MTSCVFHFLLMSKVKVISFLEHIDFMNYKQGFVYPLFLNKISVLVFLHPLFSY